MGVRASWPTPELDPAVVAELERDPFAPAPATGVYVEPEAVKAPPQPVEQVGTPIDLTGDEATLNGRLVELVGEEGSLYNDGIECPIKERHDTSCHACPISGEFGRLCEVGREQEAVCTKLVVIRCRRSK